MSGPVERNLDGIPTSELDKNVIAFYDFFRLDMPAPTGIIRRTNYPKGYVGNIDGTTQTWVHSHVAVSGINWTQPRPQDVGWVDLWNFDNLWSTLLLTVGLEYRPVQIWHAQYDAATRALLGRPRLWSGRTEKIDASGPIARFSLVPSTSGLASGAPFISISAACQNVFKDPFTCNYGPIAKPGALTLTQIGGAKSAATYFYSVTAMHGIEETDASAGSLAITASHGVRISWAPVAGATSYNVYGTASGDQKIITAATGITTTFYDDAVASPTRGTATPPVTNGTGLRTDCGHAQQDCSDRGNLIRRNAWETVLQPDELVWAQVIA